MFFKIPVLLLYFITATSCTETDPSEALSSAGPQEKTEAEIIEDSFKDFLGYFTEDLRYPREITISDCVLYMGYEITNYNIVIKYFDEKPEKRNEKIDLKLYSELFIYTCNKKNLSVQECANEWKDERIIEDSFNDCLKWFTEELGCQTRVISMGHFIKYMGKSKETYQITVDYFDEHTVKNKDDFESLNLVRFRELFTHHCKKKKLSIQECAKVRKDEAILLDSFDNCLKWTINGPNDTRHHITSDQFVVYMGGALKDYELVDKYFKDCPNAMEKNAKIDLKQYCELFKYYCLAVYPDYTIKKCADTMKSAAVWRSLAETEEFSL